MVRVWNNLMLGGQIYVEPNGYEWIIHGSDCDVFVNMVGWVHVPDSDRGYFRRQYAVDTPSYVIVAKLFQYIF